MDEMQIETTNRYCEICGVEAQMPVDTVAGLATAPQMIADAIRSSRPKGGEGWSPAEIAAHLADIEVALGWRLRQMMAEDEPELQPFDQDRWAAAMRYEKVDPDVSLRAYAATRAANVELLRMLDEAGWDRGFRHPEFGRKTLRALVEHISDHDLAHLRQIRGE